MGDIANCSGVLAAIRFKTHFRQGHCSGGFNIISMLILKAAEVNVENQTIEGTDGVRQMHVYIPKRTPLRVPQIGEWFECENISQKLILKGVINSSGIQQKPGAWNLECKTIEINVNGRNAWVPLSPGWSF